MDHRLGELHTLKRNRRIGITQCFTGRHFLETDTGGDVTRQDFLNFLTVIRVHLQDTPDPLFTSLHRIENRISRLQDAGVNANKG